MSNHLKIDFVSDVSCPWCAVGLKSLETAVAKLGDEVRVDIHFQPFELNPKMVAEGEDIGEHLARKYGSTPAQRAQSSEAIRLRGAELGFVFNMDKRSRIYNTFDAHRLLTWAEEQGRQMELKHGLLSAYFTEGENPSSHEVLVRVAVAAGLNGQRAAEILATAEYADAVREREAFYQEQGIQAVPAVIINDRHLIQGGQPPEVFEQALREIAAEE